jgi:hypothetical protein
MNYRLFALTFALLTCGVPLFSDSEEDTALFSGTETQMYNIAANKSFQENIDGRIAAYRKVIQQYPNLDAAPNASMQIFHAELTRKNYKAALSEAGDFLQKHGNYPSQHIDLCCQLARIVSDKNAPADARQKAFDLLQPYIAEIGENCAMLRDWISQRDDLTAEQKYALMLKIAKAAGNGEDPSAVTWSFASKYCNAVQDNQQRMKIVREYLESFSPDSQFNSQAKEALLGYEAASGDVTAKKRLDEFTAGQNGCKKAVSAISAKVLPLLDSKQFESAVKMLGELKEAKYPRQELVGLWSSVGAKLGGCPPEQVLDLFSLAMDTGHPRGIDNNFLNNFLNIDFYATPELSARTIKIIDRYFTPSNRAANVASSWMRSIYNRMNRSLSGNERAMLLSTLSEIAIRYKLTDMASIYLYEAGIGLLGENPELAMKYFKRNIDGGVRNKQTIQSKWLYELLSGDRKLVQSAEPRFLPERLSFKSAPVVKAPDVALTDTVILKDGYFLQTVQTAVLNGKAAVSNEVDNKTLSEAFDTSGDSAWIPENLPATLIVPLQKVSILRQVTLKADFAFEYTVTLLDRTGRKLRQFERVGLAFYAGRFYPQENSTINFTPCDNVAAIQISAYRRFGKDDGIHDIKALSSEYAMRGVKILPETAIPAGKRKMTLDYDTKSLKMDVKYQGDSCSYYRRQWFDPWKTQSVFKVAGLDFSFGIYGGRNLTLNTVQSGALNWQLDGLKSGRVEDTGKQKEEVLAAELDNKLHLINFLGSSLPAGDNVHGDDGLKFKGLQISGEATGYYAVRFNASGKWTSWLRGKNIPIPADAKSYQLAAVLDSREVLGRGTAQLREAKISFDDNAATDASEYSFSESGFISDKADELVKYILNKRPAIVFSKNGTKAEYEGAKRLAEKAGCFLISDDVEFNNRNEKRPVLAVGTPLMNRYCRALVSRLLVWDNEEFLNSKTGYAMPEPVSLEPDSSFAFITGETPEAVSVALERVISQVGLFSPASDFRLFSVPLMERVYPWQLHQGAPKLDKLSLELGRNDRRSVKAGIVFDRTAKDFDAVCGVLKNAKGEQLLVPIVRYAGYYEWVSFFGDVHLPDLLIGKPVLPIAANTASCIWLTFKTDKNTAPGKYSGQLTVKSGKTENVVPVEVDVLPVNIPDDRISSYDYARVPYWFGKDTASFWRMFRKLTVNQVEHGINRLNIDDQVKYVLKDGKVQFDFEYVLKQMKTADEIFRESGKGVPLFYFPAPMLAHQAALIYKDKQKEMLEPLPKEYSSQLAASLRKHGYWDRTWLKVGDEPGDMAAWVKSARPYKEGGMKVWTTSGKEEMSEVTDAWCPNYGHNVMLPHLESEKKEGKRPVWWYTCAGGGPGMWITSEMYNILPSYWLTAKWDFVGVDNYGAMAVGPAFSFPYRYGNGNDTRIIITPQEEIIDTPRREIESDGLHDCRLAYVIKDKIAELRKSGNNGKADELKKELDAIMFSVVPYKCGYAKDPGKWEKARHELYKLALKSQQ